MAGIYIHIPFCESRCIYCGFYSTTSLKMRDDYVDALCHEMELRAPDMRHAPVDTIYLGGGTPSQLSGEQLARLFGKLGEVILGNGERRAKCEEEHSHEGACSEDNKKACSEDNKKVVFEGNRKVVFEGMEVTMECNPDDVTDELCDTLRRLPVNRVSMGAQTFSDERLRFLRRRHNAEEVRAAVRRLRAIGIANISIDLMFGFPGETLGQWQDDIRQAIDLGVEHVSAYSLMYEEGTPLHRLLLQGKVRELDEETSRSMYETLIDTLARAGYEHYEISNFAKPGFRSRHNSSYWHEVPYVGLGAAAHSFRPGRRSWNVASIREYIDGIAHGRLPSEGEDIDAATRYNDLITTALRTADGIDLGWVRREMGDRFHDLLVGEARKHIERGLMRIARGHLSLTREGLYISDDVMSDFMLV